MPFDYKKTCLNFKIHSSGTKRLKCPHCIQINTRILYPNGESLWREQWVCQSPRMRWSTDFNWVVLDEIPNGGVPKMKEWITINEYIAAKNMKKSVKYFNEAVNGIGL